MLSYLGNIFAAILLALWAMSSLNGEPLVIPEIEFEAVDAFTAYVFLFAAVLVVLPGRWSIYLFYPVWYLLYPLRWLVVYWVGRRRQKGEGSEDPKLVR